MCHAAAPKHLHVNKKCIQESCFALVKIPQTLKVITVQLRTSQTAFRFPSHTMELAPFSEVTLPSQRGPRIGFVPLQRLWKSLKAPTTCGERSDGWGCRRVEVAAGSYTDIIRCDRNQSCQDQHDQTAWTAHMQSNPQPRGRRDVSVGVGVRQRVRVRRAGGEQHLSSHNNDNLRQLC